MNLIIKEITEKAVTVYKIKSSNSMFSIVFKHVRFKGSYVLGSWVPCLGDTARGLGSRCWLAPRVAPSRAASAVGR